MKRFSVAIVLFVAFASVLAITEEEAREKVKHAIEKCNSDPSTAIDTEEMKNYREHDGPKPATLGAHSHCLCKELGLQDENGKPKTDSIRQSLKEQGIPEDKINKLVDTCFEEKDTKEETAQAIMKCMFHAARRHSERLASEKLAAGH